MHLPAVLLRYMQGLKDHDVDAIADTVADDLAFQAPGRTLNKAQFLAFLHALYAAFPDWGYEHAPPERCGPSQFAVKWRQAGTHSAPLALVGLPAVPATGKHVAIPDQYFFYKIAGGHIAEIRPDPIPGGAPYAIFEQLGAPMPGQPVPGQPMTGQDNQSLRED